MYTFKALKQVKIAEALRDARYEVLQDKYAALVSYLKSARKFGLVSFRTANLQSKFVNENLKFTGELRRTTRSTVF